MLAEAHSRTTARFPIAAGHYWVKPLALYPWQVVCVKLKRPTRKPGEPRELVILWSGSGHTTTQRQFERDYPDALWSNRLREPPDGHEL